jgi:hypothetical protein
LDSTALGCCFPHCIAASPLRRLAPDEGSVCHDGSITGTTNLIVLADGRREPAYQQAAGAA